MTFDPRLQRGLWDAFKLSGSETVAVNQIERLSLATVALGPKPALPGPRCFVAAVLCVETFCSVQIKLTIKHLCLYCI